MRGAATADAGSVAHLEVLAGWCRLLPAILETDLASGELTDAEQIRARVIAAEKYAHPDWTMRR
jgi:hypothetical protein